MEIEKKFRRNSHCEPLILDLNKNNEDTSITYQYYFLNRQIALSLQKKDRKLEGVSLSSRGCGNNCQDTIHSHCKC